ncbi:hypothetical protein CLAIMM_03711 [Cladophialophora immunda]|nr:hypothetical protein CLAIMM_03711 [Cladophialophora immunda]
MSRAGSIPPPSPTSSTQPATPQPGIPLTSLPSSPPGTNVLAQPIPLSSSSSTASGPSASLSQPNASSPATTTSTTSSPTSNANLGRPPASANQINSPPQAVSASTPATNAPAVPSPSGITSSSGTRTSFKKRFGRFYNNRKEPKEWISFWLLPHSLLAFLLFALGLIAGIVTIKVVSHKRKGLADVSAGAQKVLSYQVGESLWWTFFPVLIFQIFGLWFTAIVGALGDRQPFVALRRDNGSNTKTTVLLDYKRTLSLMRPFVAIGNGHWTLSVSFSAALLVALFLSSLASHLFIAVAVPIVTTKHTPVTSSFNPSNFGYLTDLTPVIDVVSSTLVYGGLMPGWTTFNQSFQSFARPDMQLDSSTLATYEADTTAYSAQLNCRALGLNDYTLKVNVEEDTWTFGAQDNGCDFSPDLVTATAGFKYYLQTFSNVSCSPEAGNSRLFVLAAYTPDPSNIKPTKTTVLACRTSYYKDEGTLNVTYSQSSSSPSIGGFLVRERKALVNPLPVYYQNFEQQIHQPSIVDDTATYSATDLGRVVLAHATKYAPRSESPFDKEVMINSTSAVFTAAYAVMASSFLWQHDAGDLVTGSLTIPTVRLVVVDSIAIVLLSMLGVLVVLGVLIAIDVINHESSLYEEPIGLLGSAILLYDSSVTSLALDLRNEQEARRDGMALKHKKARGDMWCFHWKTPWLSWSTDLLNKRWKVENWERPGDSRIVEV